MHRVKTQEIAIDHSLSDVHAVLCGREEPTLPALLHVKMPPAEVSHGAGMAATSEMKRSGKLCLRFVV